VNGQIVILGGGGHAKVVVDIIRRIGSLDIVGYTDLGVGALGTTAYLGGDEILPELRRRGVAYAFVALGDNALRVERGAHARALGFILPALVCPSATLSPSAQVGAGALVMSGCVVNADACIGDLAIVNTRASVDHDCVIGPGAHVAPGAVLAGNVAVGEGAVIGAGATVINGMSIGPGAVVAAGAVVTRPVPGDALVAGVPAKRLRAARNAAGGPLRGFREPAPPTLQAVSAGDS
jgi:sugar O-acyltransferase (sialic acid O-acetyltransferase NeuD family)